MKKTIAILLTILMLFSFVQGAARENVVKADSLPIWPMFRYNAEHSGICSYDTTYNNGSLKWRYYTSHFGIDSSPAIGGDGTIYFAADVYLYAINPDGTLKWKFYLLTGGSSSPAIRDDGTIYIGSGNGILYAINPDGSELWECNLFVYINTSPVIGNTALYVGAHSLYAINYDDGSIEWYYQTGGSISSSPALDPWDGTIYFGSTDGYLYAINPDGSFKWNYPVGFDGIHYFSVNSSPSVDILSREIYVGSLAGYGICALRNDGTLKWVSNMYGVHISSSPVINGYSGIIYIGSDEGYLLAFSQYTGAYQWGYPPAAPSIGPIFSSPAFSRVGGTIFFGSSDGYVYAINSADHTLKWQYPTGGRVGSSPAIGKDGTIYVGSEDGYLYAIGPLTITASAGMGGQISPSGTVLVNYDANQEFTISPGLHYHVADVLVDGASVGAVTSYTFYHVIADHTIAASFAIDTRTITASAGLNGSISPSGAVTVNCGDDQTFAIAADSCYHILDVIVDGVSKGAVSTFTFTDVTANHTIEATFAIRTYTITASAELNGSISPSGAVVVNCGSNRTFDIEAADPCHYILDVKVDGVSKGAVSTFTFTDVTANHTIEATFAIYTYTITVSAEPTGSISPGSVVVNCGSNQTFTIESEPGFMIFRILVDGSQITISNPFTMTYTFSNVTSNHIIQAEFMKIPDITPPTITYISGIDINVPSDIKTNKDTYTFTVGAFDESGIARMIIKVNGIVQIDKNNLDPTLYLSEGVNTVEVTVYDTCGNYTTKSFKVIKDSRPPVVNLTIPEKVISSTIEVKGIIYDELSEVKSVLINGTLYNLPPSGNVSLTLNLRGGVNIITVEATDNFENTTKKTYNVTYTPVSATSIIIALQIDNPEITINGISKKIDAQGSKPIIKNGRTLLPIRVLIESLGGTVEWNAKEQKVTITLNGHSIILWIVKTTALVDGSKTTLDVASQIINGRTYLPLRFIAENLNALVQWDQSTKTVTIYYWQ